MKYCLLIYITLVCSFSVVGQKGTIKVKKEPKAEVNQTIYRDPIRFQCRYFQGNSKCKRVSLYVGVNLKHQLNSEFSIDNNTSLEVGVAGYLNQFMYRIGANMARYVAPDNITELTLGYNIHISHDKLIFLRRLKPVLEINQQFGLNGVYDAKQFSLGLAYKLVKSIDLEFHGGIMDNNIQIDPIRFIQFKVLYIPFDWSNRILCKPAIRRF